MKKPVNSLTITIGGTSGGVDAHALVEPLVHVETDEAVDEISTLARHLPEGFQVLALLAVAKDTSQKGSRLAQLYLDRCFRLSAGDLNSAQALAEEIRTLQAQD